MDGKLTSILWIGLVLIPSACASQNKQLESSHEKYFGTFAKRFTADSDSESPVIGWWAYTVPDRKEMRGRIQIKLGPDMMESQNENAHLIKGVRPGKIDLRTGIS